MFGRDFNICKPTGFRGDNVTRRSDPLNMCKQPAYNTCNTNRFDYVVCNTPKLPTEPMVCKKVTFTNPDNKFCYGNKMCNTLANIYNTNVVEHNFTMDKQPSFNNNAYALSNNSVWNQPTANPYYLDVFGKNFNMVTQSVVNHRTQGVSTVVSESRVTRRSTSQDGINIITHFEKFEPNFYLDPVGIRSIGYGHNCKARGCDHIHAPITKEQAIVLLKQDLVDVENFLNRECPNINANQFAALASLAFNIGCAKLKKFDLLKYVKAGNYSAAAKEFDDIIKADDIVMEGLVRRRAAEKALFQKPVQ